MSGAVRVQLREALILCPVCHIRNAQRDGDSGAGDARHGVRTGLRRLLFNSLIGLARRRTPTSGQRFECKRTATIEARQLQVNVPPSVQTKAEKYSPGVVGQSTWDGRHDKNCQNASRDCDDDPDDDDDE